MQSAARVRRGEPHVLQARREHCHQHCKLQHVICSHPPGSTTRDAADWPRRPLSKRFNFPRPHFAQVVTAMRDHTAAAVQSDAAHRDPHLAHLLPHEQGQVPVLRTPHLSALGARDMTRCDVAAFPCGVRSPQRVTAGLPRRGLPVPYNTQAAAGANSKAALFSCAQRRRARDRHCVLRMGHGRCLPGPSAQV